MSQTQQTAPALNPADWYQQQLAKPGFQPDAAQQAAINRLQQLHDELIKFKSVRHRPLIGWLSNEAPPRGVFFYGGVGRGKSLLMDAFFMTLPYKRKRRVHFHHFMKQVHDALNALKNEADPLVAVAEDIAEATRVLCFDEFHVNDIADAMILGRLFENLFERGVVVVTTSNYAPDDLYKNGLQRERFLPTIDLIKKNLDVMNVDSGTDYRLRTLEKLHTYHTPLDAAAEYALEETFSALSPHRDNQPVEINQRKINVKQKGMGIIWFDFAELCAGLRSQLDYLDLAQEYHTLLLSNIPHLDAAQSSEARRFTWLIDILYDHRVKFMCSAAVLPEALYLAGTRSDEFARTVSRLQEMQTKEYLAIKPSGLIRSTKGKHMEKFNAYRIFNEEGKITARVTSMTLDELDKGEVVIKAEYSSVNYKDGLAATGAGKICRKFPINGGIDVAGTVQSSNDAKFKAGDKVLVTGYDLGVAHDGGYSQLVRVPAAWVVPLLQGMTTLEAMTIGTAGFTAALSVVQLERNGLKPGNGKVIVTGATGGVGSVAVEILAGLGYDVTAVTGKDNQHDFLKQLGAKEVISRHTLEMGTKPMEKNLWAGAVDPVGGATTAWLTRTMNYGASIAVSGLTGGVEVNTTVLPFILRGVNLLGIDSVQCPMQPRLEVWRRLSTDMKLRHATAIAHVIGFEQLPETFAAILKGGVTGRNVVKL